MRYPNTACVSVGISVSMSVGELQVVTFSHFPCDKKYIPVFWGICGSVSFKVRERWVWLIAMCCNSSEAWVMRAMP